MDPKENPHRGHYEARVTSDALPKGRIACLRPNPEGTGEGDCVNCGTHLRFDPPAAWETLESLACSTACAKAAGFYPPPQKWEPSPPKKTVKDTCPSCGGPARGRGYAHTEDCDAKNHKDEEKDLDIPDDVEAPADAKPKPEPKPKVVREPCPVCGGPPGRARGWQHKEGCSNSGKAKAAALASQKKSEREKAKSSVVIPAGDGEPESEPDPEPVSAPVVKEPKHGRKPRGIFD